MTIVGLDARRPDHGAARDRDPIAGSSACPHQPLRRIGPGPVFAYEQAYRLQALAGLRAASGFLLCSCWCLWRSEWASDAFWLQLDRRDGRFGQSFFVGVVISPSTLVLLIVLAATAG